MNNSWGLPEAAKGKRPGNSEEQGKGAKAQKLAGQGADVASMGSVSSMRQPSISQEGFFNSRNRSSSTDKGEESLVRVMSTLLLFNSQKVRELEATSYYTHQVVDPLGSTLTATYQEYLWSVEQKGRKDHGLGPPAVHMAVAVIKHATAQPQLEVLQKKEGLQPLLATLQEFEAKIQGLSLEEAMDAFGHCKQNKMYDQSKTKLSFSMPFQVECMGKTTTLGSVVSRLLRSLGHARLAGVAPMGGLERKLRQLALGE